MIQVHDDLLQEADDRCLDSNNNMQNKLLFVASAPTGELI